MKNRNSLSNEKLNKASGGVYDQPTHSVGQIHYDDPIMEKVAQETYADNLMNGQNMNMAAQNQAINKAVIKHANDKNPSLKEITTYQAGHNM